LNRAGLAAILALQAYGCLAQGLPTVREVATVKQEHAVGGVEFVAGGEQLVAMSGAYAREAQVWDWRKGKQVASLPEADAVPTVRTPSRASPDGRFWARCGDGVTVWDTSTWQVLVRLPGTQGSEAPAKAGLLCRAIAFSPDGSALTVLQLAREDFPNIVQYATASWQPRWSLRTAPFHARSVAYAPDGKSIAVGGQVRNVTLSAPGTTPPTFGEPSLPDTGVIAIIDPATGAIGKTIPTREVNMFSSEDLAWGADGKTITYAGHAGFQTYEVASSRHLDTRPTENNVASPRLFPSPNGRFRIETGHGKRSEIVRVLDMSTSPPTILREMDAKPRHIAWAPDNRHFALAGAAVSLMSLHPLTALMAPASGKIIVLELRD